MRIYIYMLFFLSNSFISFSQLKVDAMSIFKMHLFLNMKLAKFTDMDPTVIKNDSLYEIFNETLDLQLDTLSSGGSYELTHGNFAKFQFYKIDLSESKKEYIAYNRKITNNEDQFIGLSSGLFTTYIIAVNHKTGASYRLMGFDTNDFLGLLLDFKEIYKSEYQKGLTTRKFLKTYHVDDLDFECLCKSLKNDNVKRSPTSKKRSPCLRRVNDPIYIVHDKKGNCMVR